LVRRSVAGFYGIGLADQEFTVMARADEVLQARLKVGTEVAGVQCVNAAVHESKTVGGANDGVARQVEDGPEVDANAGEIAAESAPGMGEGVVDGGEDGFHKDFSLHNIRYRKLKTRPSNPC